VRALISSAGELRRQLRFVPNQLTATRLALIPVLWALALTGHTFWVGIGLALAFLTDAADGFAARRFGQTSPFGSKFDSIVDGLLAPSVLAWLVLLSPAALFDNEALAAAWLATTYASIGLGLIRFRRFANLHLYSAKVAAVAQYAFVTHAFIAGAYLPVLFDCAVGFGILASAESLMLQLVLDRVHERHGSLIHALGRAR